MKKALFAFCLLMLFGTHTRAQQAPAQHGRLARTAIKTAHFLGNHVTLGVATGASSGFQAGGTYYCRHNNPDVEGCTAHYGSATGVNIANGILTGSMILLSEEGRRRHYKEWFVPEVAVLAFNTYWGIRQFRTHETPEVPEPPRPCRRSVAGLYEAPCRGL